MVKLLNLPKQPSTDKEIQTAVHKHNKILLSLSKGGHFCHCNIVDRTEVH